MKSKHFYDKSWYPVEDQETKAWKKGWQERLICELVPGDLVRSDYELFFVVGVTKRYRVQLANPARVTDYIDIYWMPLKLLDASSTFVKSTEQYNVSVEVHLK